MAILLSYCGLGRLGGRAGKVGGGCWRGEDEEMGVREGLMVWCGVVWLRWGSRVLLILGEGGARVWVEERKVCFVVG